MANTEDKPISAANLLAVLGPYGDSIKVVADDATIQKSGLIISVKDGGISKEKLAKGLFDGAEGLASFDTAMRVAESVAVLTFNVAMQSVKADQEMDAVILWDFPDDVVRGAGAWDQSGDKYVAEV